MSDLSLSEILTILYVCGFLALVALAWCLKADARDRCRKQGHVRYSRCRYCFEELDPPAPDRRET